MENFYHLLEPLDVIGDIHFHCLKNLLVIFYPRKKEESLDTLFEIIDDLGSGW